MKIKNCEQLTDYIAKNLNEDERKAFEGHLTTCENCRTEVRAVTAAGITKEKVSPLFKANPNERLWVKPLLAIALLLSLVGNLYSVVTKESSNPIVLEEEENVVDHVVKKISLQPSENSNVQVTAALLQKNETRELVVHANNLDQLEGTQVYQVWLLEDGKPYRAGTFIPDESGEGMVTFRLEYEGTHNWDTISITLESTETSETPKGKVLMSESFL